MENLFQTVRDGNLEILKEQINQSNINVLNVNNMSLLQEALKNKKDDIAFYLVEKGIHVNNQDSQGQTALHYIAVYKNNLDIAKAILAHDAQIDLKDKFGNSALWTAIFNAKGEYNFVELLLENKADLKSTNSAGKTPYDLANIMKFPELIHLVNQYSVL